MKCWVACAKSKLQYEKCLARGALQVKYMKCLAMCVNNAWKDQESRFEVTSNSTWFCQVWPRSIHINSEVFQKIESNSRGSKLANCVSDRTGIVELPPGARLKTRVCKHDECWKTQMSMRIAHMAFFHSGVRSIQFRN